MRKDEDDDDLENSYHPISSFWNSLEIPVLFSRFTDQAAASLGKKKPKAMSNTMRPTGAAVQRIQVGHVVCVAMEANPEEEEEQEEGHDYYPFRGPWKLGQVITIHSRPAKTAGAMTPRTRHAKAVEGEGCLFGDSMASTHLRIATRLAAAL
jgi:hypothetical protein